jgi:two-component system response regulator MtrA
LQETFETELISDGIIALTRLTQVVPAIIILDLHLPNHSGREILSKIHEDKRLTHTKVIVSTADARQAEAMRDDVDIVLLKPVSPVQMRELAGRLMASP